MTLTPSPRRSCIPSSHHRRVLGLGGALGLASFLSIASMLSGCGTVPDEVTATDGVTTDGSTTADSAGFDDTVMEDATASTVSDSADGGSGATTDDPPGPGIDVQCDGQGGSDPDDGVICFYDVEGQDMGPAANLEYSLVQLDGQDAIYVKLVFAPWFADNTYGANAVDWPEGHEFDELVGSDRANLVMTNAAGEVVLDFDLDYIEDDEDAPSGFRSQGVWEKNGEMHVGDPDAVLAANSSLSRNLNERGHDQYLEDSPATDDAYTPNPAAPDWDFRVVYEVWVDASLFEGEGGPFAEVCVMSIHASPSKADDNEVDVVPDECPPGWGCFLEDGCTECDPFTDPDLGEDCDPGDGIPPVP